MANKHLNRCTTFIIIKEVQIQLGTTLHLKLGQNGKSVVPSAGKDMGNRFIHSGQDSLLNDNSAACMIILKTKFHL